MQSLCDGCLVRFVSKLGFDLLELCIDFFLEAGVRQGCPLSPLVYATVAEVMLDKIEQQCSDTLAICYADDTALVVSNCWEVAPTLEKLFGEFTHISGLQLNLRKCVLHFQIW